MTIVRLAPNRGHELERHDDAELDAVAQLARDANASIAEALTLAVTLGPTAPHPGSGATVRLWEMLATIGSVDLTVARVVEPHLDALSIITAADAPIPGAEQSTWGVFAAEGPGMTMTALVHGGRWTLSGQKPWCSLAAHLDFALVTARTSAEHRRLFAVRLRDPGVSIASGGWSARGLAAVESGPISLNDVDAIPVGADEWYLERPGFSWGGIGVAAIWYGASVALGRRLRSALTAREPDQIGLMLLGDVDLELHQARTLLFAASAEVDSAEVHSAEVDSAEVDSASTAPAVVAQRVRSAVSRSAERVSQALAHALGPGPLATDEDHSRRVADLALYIRQDHAERDLARLGKAILDMNAPPW